MGHKGSSPPVSGFGERDVRRNSSFSVSLFFRKSLGGPFPTVLIRNSVSTPPVPWFRVDHPPPVPVGGSVHGPSVLLRPGGCELAAPQLVSGLSEPLVKELW